MSAAAQKRSIGFLGATVTMVGLVIGVAIFILPGNLAGTAGPAVVFSYVLASFLAFFSCVVAAQVGSAVPVSGASFVVVARLVSPFWGFSMMWMMFGGVAVAVALLSFGFADYLNLIWPGANRQVIAAGLVIAITALNILGIRESVAVQALMVMAFIAALGTFCVAAYTHLDPALLVPVMPNGITPVVAAAVPAFFSFAGFMAIIEIGGEIRNPGRTIPAALFASFMIVLAIYVAVAIALVGVVPWTELADSDAPVGLVAGQVLPPWFARIISLTALAAAATSVNVLLLSYPRDVLPLARARLLPVALGKTSARTGEPVYGVLFFAALSLIAVAAGGRVIEYATLTVIGLMLLQILVAIAALRLPGHAPEQYQRAGFRLSKTWLAFFGVGLILFSIGFLVVAAIDSPRVSIIALVFLALGAAFYYFQRHRLEFSAIQIEA